ncbi:MAG: pyridoxamine 5'-phosphate oxidase family protein [Actinobacteria bacterium]|nr:MAG: pyridoxamine 5'-phosphate oxidase family protein [Actinomycetota bacterium]
MTPEQIDAFLAESHLCHFATVDAKGHPRVRPVWYLWRDGGFWLTTRRESRHTGRDLANQPRVAISVGSEGRPYKAVIAHGTPSCSRSRPDTGRSRAAAGPMRRRCSNPTGSSCAWSRSSCTPGTTAPTSEPHPSRSSSRLVSCGAPGALGGHACTKCSATNSSRRRSSGMKWMFCVRCASMPAILRSMASPISIRTSIRSSGIPCGMNGPSGFTTRPRARSAFQNRSSADLGTAT